MGLSRKQGRGFGFRVKRGKTSSFFGKKASRESQELKSRGLWGSSRVKGKGSGRYGNFEENRIQFGHGTIPNVVQREEALIGVSQFETIKETLGIFF